MGKKAVPYTSLFELAELRGDYEKYVLRKFKRKQEDEEEKEEGFGIYNDEVKKYTWKDYISADIVFVFLTTLDNAQIESNTLKALLEIRSNKMLPTVVLTDSSLDAYESDARLKRYVWDDIVAPSEEMATYDRMLHVSTYKRYKIMGEARRGVDY